MKGLRKSSRLAPQFQALLDAYGWAKCYVVQAGFQSEIAWQNERRLASLTEDQFVRQAAWVILSGGMAERVIRGLFPAIERSFVGFTSASQIVRNRARCRRDALRAFNHAGKIDAIVEVATHVDDHGFDHVVSRLVNEGVDFLRSFSFLGPATAFHLAKNLGLDVAKPDRHLVRIAAAAGYADAHSMCRDLASHVGDSVAVVDLVLWRFATLHSGYEGLFTYGERGSLKAA